MNNMKYKYFIFKGLNDLEYLLIDRERKIISTLKNGQYNNETKQCEKIYVKDKEKDWDKRRVGSNWVKCLITGEKDGILDEVVIQTNDLKKYDLKCMEIRKEQLERMLKGINRDKEKLLKEEQYYTYAFSNLKYAIGEDSLNNKYFKGSIEKENILDRIIKPSLYDDKEQEYTILDEDYDLGTTFYYIDEINNNYDRFMKFLSENLIVKDIFKDNTIIVGICEFVNANIKELNNIFGEQTEETHIENLIKMIDGNATESCYEDFNKEFKIDYKFMFCNYHTFDEIKRKTMEDLDYEKAHDLAVIENKEAHVSAYLGVYDNEFQVTYSVHSKNDFENNFENIIADFIDIKEIKDESGLENKMRIMLEDFYNSRAELVEALSQKLAEDEMTEQQETEEQEEEV